MKSKRHVAIERANDKLVQHERLKPRKPQPTKLGNVVEKKGGTMYSATFVREYGSLIRID